MELWPAAVAHGEREREREREREQRGWHKEWEVPKEAKKLSSVLCGGESERVPRGRHIFFAAARV
jgi:hypothetical protein